MDNVLCIPDLQCPAHHPDAFEFLARVNDALKPSSVICIGDEVDHTALARSFKPSPDLPSAGDEFIAAKKALDDLESIFPALSLCYSNHGARLWKKAHDAGIPTAWIRSPVEAYDKPNWEWSREWWVQGLHGNVMFHHGDRKKGAFAYAKMVGASVFSGHQHSMMGIQWQNSRHQIIFGCDVGSLADTEHLALLYAKDAPLGQMMGCAALIDGLPRLIMMTLDDAGRWDGRVSI